MEDVLMAHQYYMSLAVMVLSGFVMIGCWGETSSTFVTQANNYSVVYDTSTVREIHRIYVMPVWKTGSTATKPEIAHSATMLLWNEIDSSRLFSLISMDTVIMYLEKFKNLDTNVLFSVAESIKVDGFIMLSINYSKADIGVTNTASTTLRLVSIRTRKAVAYASHDTYTSHSYLLPPSQETVTKDAIDGAVDELAEEIKGIRRR
jgi:hypothetical protein